MARRLGVSKRTIERFEARGVLHPRRDAAGIWRFDAAEVSEIAERRRQPLMRSEGELAAAAFRLFETGAPFARCVRELCAPPAEVRRLYGEYQAGFREPASRTESAKAEDHTAELDVLEELIRKSAGIIDPGAATRAKPTKRKDRR